MNIRWLTRGALEAIHNEQLAEHGGLSGIKDESALEASLARPLNKAAYGETDVFELAAAYLFAIVRDHPFSDGKKRTGYVASYAFLYLNGYEITADNGLVYQFVMDVAAGLVSEQSAARWFRDCTAPRASRPS
ncbi:MAG: type II toxin-antitoxin system death-on-curing family toxin [Rhizobiaceae bacterium]|nr:type II toxin-antitoxin system death-on-curing family toxin [Rhizobiaceae bacterium]